ncbi:Cysteine-rich membrane protein 2 [Spironucleus salmonicida]|nr:Cysteine-rich membrane protein 2 [Spironucleus salmonicida]
MLNCETVNVTDNKKCDLCEDQFSLSVDQSSCTSCTSVSLSCTCNSHSISSCTSCKNNTCGSCLPNYTLFNNTCSQSCTVPFCKVCNPTDVKKCTSCKTFYFVQTDATCAKCPDNCETCNSSSCLTCSSGYGISNKKCLPCPRNCKNCVSQTCNSCFDGYVLSNNSCIACPLNNAISALFTSACPCGLGKNCANCGVKGCGNCLVGYHLSAITCTKCPDQTTQIGPKAFCKTELCRDQNCIDCQYKKNVCRLCQNGFEINAIGKCVQVCQQTLKMNEYCNNGKVSPCDSKQNIGACYCTGAENCQSCDTTGNNCAKCFLGYKQNKDGKCVECDKNYLYEPGNLRCNPLDVEVISGAGISAIVFACLWVIGGIAYGIFRYKKFCKIERAFISGKPEKIE